MVGDFGEVYVMDWGLAKVLASVEPGSWPSAQTDRLTSPARHVSHVARSEQGGHQPSRTPT